MVLLLFLSLMTAPKGKHIYKKWESKNEENIAFRICTIALIRSLHTIATTTHSKLRYLYIDDFVVPNFYHNEACPRCQGSF